MRKVTLFIVIAGFLITACTKKQEKEMKEFQKVSIEDINVSAAKLIGKDWMLITAGKDTASFNTMTASGGCLGYLWEKPVAIVYIRPQRYTKEFVDKNDIFTLSFFDTTYRNALTICGTKSGRDTDKVAEAGITPYNTPAGSVAFEQANMVMECKKLYAMPFNPEFFIDTHIISHIYPDNDFHTIYIAEIINVYRK